MSDTEFRFILFGTRGAFDDYITHSDDETLLRKEGFKRLQQGYTASLYDNVYQTQTDLQLFNCLA